MRVTVDTNVLVRAVICDEPQQAPLATELLRNADLIAIPLPVLCEFVWVLKRGYKLSSGDVAAALDRLLSAPNVVYDEQAARCGLTFLRAGGDFADGVIAFGGQRLGAENFATFDHKAAHLASTNGLSVQLLEAAPD